MSPSRRSHLLLVGQHLPRGTPEARRSRVGAHVPEPRDETGDADCCRVGTTGEWRLALGGA